MEFPSEPFVAMMSWFFLFPHSVLDKGWVNTAQ